MEDMPKSEEEWKEKLSDEQYRVMRKKGTEPAFSGKFHDHKEDGMYVCAACGQPLFNSNTKYDSGTGWPSFYDAQQEHVDTKLDFKIIMPRTEVHCKHCGSHLGHVFNDGPKPTGKRYCINSCSLDFKKR